MNQLVLVLIPHLAEGTFLHRSRDNKLIILLISEWTLSLSFVQVLKNNGNGGALDIPTFEYQVIETLCSHLFIKYK
jgi:hypothetical protein